MASYEHELLSPPMGSRARELWLQHAAGLILFEDVRRYALERISRSARASSKTAARKATDDALYVLMMVIDGVSGAIQSGEHRVSLQLSVLLERGGRVIQEINLSQDSDGMCMGYHGWLQGDFGEDPLTRKKPQAPRPSKVAPRRGGNGKRTAAKKRT